MSLVFVITISYLLSYSAFIFNGTPRKVNKRRILTHITATRSNDENNVEYITFVSSNRLKIEEVKSILGSEFPFQLRFEGLDLEEPQATPIEISQAKCKNACELVNGPVVVEDTSLCFNALNGLPGQYIKWFYEALGNEGLEKLLAGFEDRSAYAECVLSFSLGKGFPVKSFVGIAEGKAFFFSRFILHHLTFPINFTGSIVPPTKKEGFGWDPIFKPLGKDITFAEMDKTEKNLMSHRYKAFRQFKAYVNDRMDSFSREKMPPPAIP